MDRCDPRPSPLTRYNHPQVDVDPHALLYAYRSLSNEEVNAIHGKVEANLLQRLAVEIR